MTRVRGVVGGDRLDRPVAEAVDQRRAVVTAPERWVHLQVRVERAKGLVRQAEVMRGHLRRRRHARGASRANGVDRLAGGDVQDVHGPPLEGGERQVRSTITLSAIDG